MIRYQIHFSYLFSILNTTSRLISVSLSSHFLTSFLTFASLPYLSIPLGEIVTLPLVVLVSFLAQPRLQYAMATDGLLPKIFAEVDRKGNLVRGIVISGAICTVIALLVPFKYLDDMISAGVLISFNLTNSSLIIIRRCDNSNPYPCTTALILFNVSSVLLHVLLVNLAIHTSHFVFTMQICIAAILLVSLVICTYYISCKCPENDDPESVHQFRVPGLPFVPLFGIFVNYLLLAQLSVTGIGLIFCYFGVASVFYFGYGIHNSKGNNTGWREILTEIPLDDSVRKYGNMDIDFVGNGHSIVNHDDETKSVRSPLNTVHSTAHSTVHRHDSCNGSDDNANSNGHSNGNKIASHGNDASKESATGIHGGKRKTSPHSHAALCAQGLSSDDDDKKETDNRIATSQTRKKY
jgi:C-terminus of AA_permease